ncbi:hypothetical protein RDI58_028612 [Solanum bulbocastanum]|uniref:Uncharacterized protein n=1 Tax=Solanum bulbocastanum TaxID=147425 RepID=A0AAN8SSA0_SOLBU
MDNNKLIDHLFSTHSLLPNPFLNMSCISALLSNPILIGPFATPFTKLAQRRNQETLIQVLVFLAMVLIIALNQLKLAFQVSKKSFTSTNIPKTSTFMVSIYVHI